MLFSEGDDCMIVLVLHGDVSVSVGYIFFPCEEISTISMVVEQY